MLEKALREQEDVIESLSRTQAALSEALREKSKKVELDESQKAEQICQDQQLVRQIKEGFFNDCN